MNTETKPLTVYPPYWIERPKKSGSNIRIDQHLQTGKEGMVVRAARKLLRRPPPRRPTPSTASLFTLPINLRQKIYREVLRSNEHPPPRIRLAFLLACRFIYVEAAPLAYRQHGYFHMLIPDSRRATRHLRDIRFRENPPCQCTCAVYATDQIN